MEGWRDFRFELEHVGEALKGRTGDKTARFVQTEANPVGHLFVWFFLNK